MKRFIEGEDRSQVTTRVAPHARIRAVEFVDAIPKSPFGKIFRRELRERMNP